MTESAFENVDAYVKAVLRTTQSNMADARRRSDVYGEEFYTFCTEVCERIEDIIEAMDQGEI